MSITGYAGDIYSLSEVEHEGTTYFLGRSPTGARQLGILGDTEGFDGVMDSGNLFVAACSSANLAQLRRRLPWLNPVPLGRHCSFGFGDRIGNATAGHMQALRTADPQRSIAPIFAQQSVRENSRTGRSPQQVMEDVIWTLFQEGWRGAWGADADHVKEIAHLSPFVAAGYTFYTIDPSDYVDNAAQSDSVWVLREKVSHLPWEELGTTYDALHTRYCREPFALGGLDLDFEETTLLRALAKYGNAFAHTLRIAKALNESYQGRRYELEMSVDETDTPTSLYEHFLIANELVARDIPLVSLAPRFVGKFQKGVDYIGEVAEFEQELAGHVAIMEHFESYKLSIHTGSDKFTLYPIIAHHTKGRVHVKTAGTSYLEALRVVAAVDPALFRAILDTARAHFEHDRKSYVLDAILEKVPTGDAVADEALPDLLEHFDTRQVLHVAFGTILTTYGASLHPLLTTHEAAYRAGLERHFVRHVAPFAQTMPVGVAE